MHIGDMGASGVGDPEANFWLDGVQLRTKGKGSHNSNTYPEISKSVVIVAAMNTQSAKSLRS